MTYSQLIKAVASALTPLVTAQRGTLVIAESLEEAQKFLEAAPNSWRLIIHWEGYGDHQNAREGMTSHQVASVIQAPRGLTVKPDHTRTKPDGSPNFSDLISLVQSWFAAMRFPDGTGADVAGFALGGSQWLATSPGFAAHVLNWRLDAALPPYEKTIALNFPELTTNR